MEGDLYLLVLGVEPGEGVAVRDADHAEVGRTGNVDSPQLHFEVRKGTQAVDPMGFLEK